MSKTIVSDTKSRQRIDAMARVFTKADRVLSGDPVDVVVTGSLGSPFSSALNNAPSWTDGRTITFNKDMIGDVTTVEDIIRLTGLNYHELAHVLYTPRSGTKMVQAIRAEGLDQEFNILEDQRIETLLTSVYPSTIPYLVSTFMKFCIQSDSSWDTNFALAHGRKYLPSDVRAEFRRRFIHQALVSKIESIIDEYRTLAYPADAERGLELTRELNALMIGNVRQPYGHSSNQRPDINSGRAATQSEQRDAVSEVEDADKELEEEDRLRKESEGENASDDSDDVDASDDSEGAGDSDSSDSEDESGHSGSSSDDEGEQDSFSKAATGQGSSAGTTTEFENGSEVSDEDLEFKKVLQKTANTYEQSDEVVEDVAAKQRAIVRGEESLDSKLNIKRYRENAIYPDDVSVARRFSSILERLSADADPGWEQFASSGKINMQRAMSDSDYDRIWDRWEEGNNDATDIECVINIDTSGSMTYLIDQASRALWVIKNSLETLNANVTVISYGGSTNVVYQKSERVSKTKYKQLTCMGNTYARPAVEESVRILESSKRHNKIFISITDGQWDHEMDHSDRKSSNQLISELNKVGVTTALAYIGHPYYLERHNCKIATSVVNPIELIDFAKQIVQATIAPRKVA